MKCWLPFSILLVTCAYRDGELKPPLEGGIAVNPHGHQRWEEHRPPEMAVTSLQQKAAAADRSPSLLERGLEGSVGEAALPPGWSSARDPTSGKEYYWQDARPHETQTWEKPPEAIMDICGHTCEEAMGLGDPAQICQITWNAGCGGHAPPTGFSGTSTIRELCAEQCEANAPVEPVNEIATPKIQESHVKSAHVETVDISGMYIDAAGSVIQVQQLEDSTFSANLVSCVSGNLQPGSQNLTCWFLHGESLSASGTVNGRTLALDLSTRGKVQARLEGIVSDTGLVITFYVGGKVDETWIKAEMVAPYGVAGRCPADRKVTTLEECTAAATLLNAFSGLPGYGFKSELNKDEETQMPLQQSGCVAFRKGWGGGALDGIYFNHKRTTHTTAQKADKEICQQAVEVSGTYFDNFGSTITIRHEERNIIAAVECSDFAKAENRCWASASPAKGTINGNLVSLAILAGVYGIPLIIGEHKMLAFTNGVTWRTCDDLSGVYISTKRVPNHGQAYIDKGKVTMEQVNGCKGEFKTATIERSLVNSTRSMVPQLIKLNSTPWNYEVIGDSVIGTFAGDVIKHGSTIHSIHFNTGDTYIKEA